MASFLNTVTRIISVGSVDGVCTSAAVLSLVGVNTPIEFTQAFTVEKIDVSAWGEPQCVLFVDLAVNNREPSMTVEFLRRVTDAGHSIVGVCDEHNADDWQMAFAEAGLDFSALEIQPVSGKGTSVNSSGALLLRYLISEDCSVDVYECPGDGIPALADKHIRELCMAADAGDRMDFSTRFGGMVNAAVKSRIADDSRRVHLARHLAEHDEPDEKITGWIKEYQAILASHSEILAAAEQLGDGIVRASAVGKVVDMTTLMSEFYRSGARVVALEGEMFDKAVGAKVRQIAFGTQEKGLDLLATVKAVVPSASGFAQKANVKPENEATAIGAIRALLRG